MKIPAVNKIRGYNMTLYEEINSLGKSTTTERVSKLYGKIGVDIFEGKQPTILSEEDVKEAKKLKNRIKAWWSGTGKYDYQSQDRLRDVILKYACNKKNGCGTVKEIEDMFGSEGKSELTVLARMGYMSI